jgi:2-octaprenyl-6-methoxyphenol hydroxylase
MKQNYDILIIGAGIVGASLVLALSHLPLRIALVEQAPFHERDPIPDTESKPIALNYTSIRILQTLIPWAELAPYSTPIETVHISEQGCFAAARIKAKDMGVSALGAVIPAAQLGWMLTKTLRKLAAGDTKRLSLALFNPARCEALLKTEQGWQVQIKVKEGMQTICAPLVIAADGSHSIVRELAGIKIRGQDKAGQMALVTTLTVARHHRHIAYQRFTHQGVLACLPLLGNSVGFIWTAAQPIIEKQHALPASDFLAQVQQLFAYRLGRFLERGQMRVYPVKSFSAEPQAKEGLLLLGNAAHTLSPIAAQGLNLALQDVAALVDILAKALRMKKEWADPSIIQRYLTARLPKQKQLIRFTDNLESLFQEKFTPLTLLRNSGLLVFDLVSPLKRNVLRRLMGTHGSLSSLARGLTPKQEEEYVKI